MMIDGNLGLHIPGGGSAPNGHLELMGARSSSLGQAYGRIVMVSIFFTLAYLVIAIRAFDLMIIQGTLAHFRDTEGLNTSIVSTVSAPRRDILDRNGMLLATSIKTASLYADPKRIIDLDGTAKGLNKIFPDLAYGDLVKKLDPSKRFVWIKRNLTPQEQAAVLELGQPGLEFEEEYRRLYPEGPLTSHIVGYSGVDGTGLGGLEQGLNPLLKDDGDPVTLTLDVRLQHILRRELQKTITDFTAAGGAGMIMDVKTGDVLASVSLPDFDPHTPTQSATDAKFNRVTLGTYELGSTFKIFTTAALLEQQRVPLSESFDTRNPIKVGRFTISDYHPENRVQTIPEIFMHSSNIGTAMMAQQIGTEGLKSFFDQLGFFKPIAYDVPEIGKPQLPNPWREVSTLTASYGHGIAITPLQLAAATATIIGDGTPVHPHLILNNDKKDKSTTRVVSTETTQKMRDLMRLVVKHGTGSKADVPGLLIGGKTGTAEKNVNGRYVEKALISSFVGAFPMNNPRYLILVSIDEPHPNKSSYGYATAGWTAAPTVARVASGMAGVLGIVPDLTAHDPADALTAYLADFKDKTDTPETETPTIGVTPVAAVPTVP